MRRHEYFLPWPPVCLHITCAVTKIKQDLIHKAKLKKQYAKIKAQEQAKNKKPNKPQEQESAERQGSPGSDSDGQEGESLHPTRQLMLKDEEAAQTGVGVETPSDDKSARGPSDGERRRTRRPGYYDKQLQKAEQRREEAQAQAQEAQRRREERERRIAERERYRRAMAKTRGPDGKKKLGRESTILLDKVKKLMNES